MKKILLVILVLWSSSTLAQDRIEQCNVVWTSQSKNSGESMPCGGGDIGLNVWVENGDIYFYIARSGFLDENNALLKAGRVRLRLSPNPFAGTEFKQELQLQNGSVVINGKAGAASAQVKIWVDVFRPVIHVSVHSNRPVKTETGFETWRFEDRPVTGRENNQGSWKFAPQGKIFTRKDHFSFTPNGIFFNHQNLDSTIFDVTVKQQGMEGVKGQLYNPLKGLLFGGLITGKGLKRGADYSGTYVNTNFKGYTLESAKPVKNQEIIVALNTIQGGPEVEWKKTLTSLAADANAHAVNYQKVTADWWKRYWERSYVYLHSASDSVANQVGQNYQLFRYMLGCNAFGSAPTKFNGGFFTYDPVFSNSAYSFTPDFRNWGGGLNTMQNQRLVYFPMLKNGDFDLMMPQLEFYLKIQKTAELRSKVYWNHNGACFTEQMENFGLPNAAEYTWKRPVDFDKGVEYNAWLEYTWDTVFEFCLMMLEQERYAGKDISKYVPFIKSCLTFFDEHYQYLARHRSAKALDGAGHLVLYPGSAAETFKMAYNANSTIAALQVITSRMLELPDNILNAEDRKYLEGLKKRIPPITYREMNGHKMLSPAQNWERINNTENVQFYTVFPWGIHGVNKPEQQTALDTWKYDTLAVKFRSHVGWKQDNIFAAGLGLAKEAWDLTSAKLKNSGRRFPAFWGPGYDWTPDHNWGGSGMIGLQEMLLQTDGDKIYLFPAWPADKDVHFKLHAPKQTTIEATLRNGKVTGLVVLPAARKKDVQIMLQSAN